MTEFNKQPTPELSEESEPVWPKVIKALRNVKDDLNLSSTELKQLEEIMESRNQFGINKYGVPLSTFNKRDPLQDAFEEALDLVVYSSQAWIEAQKRDSRSLWLIEELEESAFRILVKCFKALREVEKYG